MKFVNPSCSDNKTCEGAGTKLKATSGWNYTNVAPVGTDDFGFAALPGGISYSDGSFGSVGDACNWWSASEMSANIAYGRGMGNGIDGVAYIGGNKGHLYGVRCLQD